MFTSQVNADYCEPPFFDVYGPDPLAGITNVTISGETTLNNNSPYDDKYKFFSNKKVKLQKGKKYNYSLEIYSYTGQNTRIWIDWNQDEIFEPKNELASIGQFFAGGSYKKGIVSSDFTVPINAKKGETRMRVYTDMIPSEGHIEPEPCGYLNHQSHPVGHHGNVEDYIVIVSDNNVPIISTSESDLDFGGVNIKTTKPKKLIIKNDGNIDLEISDINFDWNEENIFGILDDIKLPMTIKPNTEEIIEITFTPKEEKNYIAFITIMSNADNLDELEIGLEGTGIIDDSPIISSDKESIEFGEIELNEVNISKISLKNIGTSDLIVSEIYSLEFKDVFNIRNQLQVVKPSKSLEIEVEFKPDELIDYSTQIIIKSNAKEDFSINISGKGIENTPKISIPDHHKDFGKIEIDKYDIKTVEIINPGKIDLELTSFEFEDNTNDIFNLLNISKLPIVLQSDESFFLEIKFSPEKSTKYTSQVLVKSNSENIEHIELVGEGEEPNSVISENNNYLILRYNEKYNLLNIEMTNLNRKLDLNNVIKSFTIIDLNGNNIIISQENISIINDNSFFIDISNLNNGAYSIVFKVHGKVSSRKFIISK